MRLRNEMRAFLEALRAWHKVTARRYQACWSIQVEIRASHKADLMEALITSRRDDFEYEDVT